MSNVDERNRQYVAEVKDRLSGLTTSELKYVYEGKKSDFVSKYQNGTGGKLLNAFGNRVHIPDDFSERMEFGDSLLEFNAIDQLFEVKKEKNNDDVRSFQTENDVEQYVEDFQKRVGSLNDDELGYVKNGKSVDFLSKYQNGEGTRSMFFGEKKVRIPNGVQERLEFGSYLREFVVIDQLVNQNKTKSFIDGRSR